MTVSEFEAVLLSLEEQEAIERYGRWQHTAFICAFTHNKLRAEGTDPVDPEDLIPVPYPGEKPKETAPRQQTWQEQLQIIKTMNAAMGGDVVVRR